MEATIASSSLLNDIVEEIFLQLPVKSLIRFKSLSKQWKSTIESHSFGERHLKIVKRSHVDHSKAIAISRKHPLNANGSRPDTDIGFRTICLESGSLLSFTLLNFPQGFDNSIIVSESCNGLLCIHSRKTQSIYVVNPATRWLRQLPPARFKILFHKFNPTQEEDRRNMKSVYHIVFVKTTDYKLVWLYNSHTYNSDASSPNEGVTKCEVFDFRANAWRYLTCTPSFRICRHMPISVNGSIYWMTDPYYGEIKVVALDIHTETFRVLPRINPVIASPHPYQTYICSLDNSLCISILTTGEHNTKMEVIWRMKSSEDMWEKFYIIDFLSSPLWRYPKTGIYFNNKKIFLLYRFDKYQAKYDPQTKSFRNFLEHSSIIHAPYFQSLISYI